MNIKVISEKDNLIKFDSGFYFGKGLFETILILEKPIFLKEHLDRLNSGLAFLEIDICIREQLILEKIKDYRDCALKLMVSENNIILSSRDLTYTRSKYKEGFKVKLSNCKRNAYSNIVNLKTFNYIENIIEKNKANSEGYDEVVFLNTDNFISEGSMSNLFIIMEDYIVTPTTDCGILNGVVRTFIIDKLKKKYNIVEGKITLDIVNSCKGMFLTNSLMGVMWVNNFNKIILEKSNIYEEIKNYYDTYIGF